MIRFLWLQSRKQFVLLVGALVVAAIALFITGKELRDLYESTIVNCESVGTCGTAAAELQEKYSNLRTLLDMFVLVMPALVGVFWGAPLVAREFETGTFRLAWSQGVTRTQWMVAKLFGVGLAAMLITGVVSWMITLWGHPVDRTLEDQYSLFDERNIVPIAYSAFAFTLGVTTGLFVRRTLPSMVIVLVLFSIVRIFDSSAIRDELVASKVEVKTYERSALRGISASPAGDVTPAVPDLRIPDAWVLSKQFVDKSGHVPSEAELVQFVKAECPNIPAPRDRRLRVMAQPSQEEVAAFQACMDKVHETFDVKVKYQPASNYWKLQWIESAIFITLALALSMVCILRVRRGS